jgi:type 1 glutamine amidotransferase
VSAQKALVLAGGVAPYVDPWHPFGPTSELLAGVAREAGFDVEVATDVVARLADLTGVDLLIANVPAPDEELDPTAVREAQRGLDAFLTRPGGVVALHVSVTTLIGLDSWSSLIGARWAKGRTMHPPRGISRVRTVGSNPITTGLGEWTLDDELYSYLKFEGDREPVVVHDYEGVAHPLIWVRELPHTRVVADAMGHGTESYDSAEHLTILHLAMQWAGGIPARPGTKKKE